MHWYLMQFFQFHALSPPTGIVNATTVIVVVAAAGGGSAVVLLNI